MSHSDYSSEDEQVLFGEDASKLPDVIKPDMNDETSKFLFEYVQGRKWDGKKPELEDHEGDSMDAIDDATEFERNYNFRFEEEGSNIVETHPRHVEGEERAVESARKRRRREKKEEKEQNNETTAKKLELIDEKYKQLAGESGRLTPEQLSAYIEETAAVMVEEQGGAFPYNEVAEDGGIPTSINIIEKEGDVSSEGSESEDDEEDNRKNKKNPREFQNKKNPHNKNFNRKSSNQKSPHSRSARKDTYFSHRK